MQLIGNNGTSWYICTTTLINIICMMLCKMKCYVMFCYVMLCYVMLCYVMLCYVMLCDISLCYAMFCHIMLFYVMLLSYVALCFIMMLCNITLHNFLLYVILSFYVALYHATVKLRYFIHVIGLLCDVILFCVPFCFLYLTHYIMECFRYVMQWYVTLCSVRSCHVI